MRDLSRLRDGTQDPCIGRWVLPPNHQKSPGRSLLWSLLFNLGESLEEIWGEDIFELGTFLVFSSVLAITFLRLNLKKEVHKFSSLGREAWIRPVTLKGISRKEMQALFDCPVQHLTHSDGLISREWCQKSYSFSQESKSQLSGSPTIRTLTVTTRGVAHSISVRFPIQVLHHKKDCKLGGELQKNQEAFIKAIESLIFTIQFC